MAYRGLTKTGTNYLATRLANELPVEFIKVVIGNGIIPQEKNPSETTELYSLKQEVKILKKTQIDNSISITVQVTNENVIDGFYLKEIGVYVNDNGANKLYWYCNEDNAQYIPKKTDTPINFEIEIKMEVTNIDSPIVNWSGEGTWITKEYLDKELSKVASSTELGRIKIGETLTITPDGILNARIVANEKITALVNKYKVVGDV